ncbi:molybdenum cofactor guanylyltransferase [Frigidibacter sp. MR17.24]|uniref:molybdenum cofactor guanylyltransferase n=1 Tax=Frigidibacter sp. MR17.24 TaxID=3127345 RepID=UPI0030131D96
MEAVVASDAQAILARTAVVVLAGGRSRRMGRDKAQVRLGGGRLLDHALAGAARIAPGALLALSWNGPAPDLAPLPPLLADPLPDHPGPLAGVLAGLGWAAGTGRDWLLTLPVDTPFLPADTLARLAAATGARPEDGPADDLPPGPVPRLARAGGRLHPAVALWPVALAAPLARALAAGERRVARWAEAAGALPVDFPDAAGFDNLNTPEDLARAEARLAVAARA